jgi:Zn-finger nucleic acid-binding protein
MQWKQAAGSFVCEYCKSTFVPEKDVDGLRVVGPCAGDGGDDSVAPDCPVCQTPLVDATLAAIPITHCAKCSGMLLAMAAFQELAESYDPPAGADVVQLPADSCDLKRKINCPRCHHPMDAHFYAGPGRVVIDSCEDCELIWLDQGELKRIALARKLE